jgi:hypothetical protein
MSHRQVPFCQLPTEEEPILFLIAPRAFVTMCVPCSWISETTRACCCATRHRCFKSCSGGGGCEQFSTSSGRGSESLALQPKQHSKCSLNPETSCVHLAMQYWTIKPLSCNAMLDVHLAMLPCFGPVSHCCISCSPLAHDALPNAPHLHMMHYSMQLPMDACDVAKVELHA